MSKVADVFETLEYGPAPESARFVNDWLEKHDRAFGHFIGGSWTDPSLGVSFETANPATAETIPLASQSDCVDRIRNLFDV